MRIWLPALFGLAALCAATAASASPEDKESAESSASPYVVLDPIPISIIRDGSGRGMLLVEFGIDAGTLNERKETERLMPRLTDLYIQVLNLYASRDLVLNHSPDAETIRKRLQEATDQVLGGKKGVVLMRQLMIRRKNQS
jgi:hypothetical protein